MRLPSPLARTLLLMCACLAPGAASLASPRTASADKASDARARDLYQQGQKAYDIGDFPRAIELFKQSYDVLPRPLLLFNIAQAHRLLGQHRQSLFFYQNYLSQQPDAPNRARVEGWIGELKQKIAAEDAAKTTPDPLPDPRPDPQPDPQPDPLPDPQPDPGPTKIPPPDKVAEGAGVDPGPQPERDDRGGGTPIYKKWWLWTGVVVVAGGVAAYFLISSSNDEPANPNTHFTTVTVF